uniref:Uncharacterized protein n=1 Tax=Lepeophtheirus salmonis TaxID=72036 RepID=A0A0K2T4H9_LEPSM
MFMNLETVVRLTLCFLERTLIGSQEMISKNVLRLRGKCECVFYP